jgi:hypothetical protein
VWHGTAGNVALTWPCKQTRPARGSRYSSTAGSDPRIRVYLAIDFDEEGARKAFRFVRYRNVFNPTEL